MREFFFGGIPADMEPVEINRSALIATVKRPFVDWLHTADPTSKHIGLAEVNHEPTVYLVPEFESKEEFAEWLEQHCEIIFEEQLGGWWTDNHGLPIGASKYFRNGSNAACTRWSWISMTSRFSWASKIS